MRFILRSKNELKKAKNANKIITNKREIKKAKRIKVKARETKIKVKITKINTKANARISAIAIATTTITTTNKKRLLRLCKQFVYTYINFVLKTTLILLSYLLLFNNL